VDQVDIRALGSLRGLELGVVGDSVELSEAAEVELNGDVVVLPMRFFSMRTCRGELRLKTKIKIKTNKSQ
jgi:hypothetical protein